MPNEQDITYDRFGAARLRILKDDRVVTRDGQHVGVSVGNAVYGYSGLHVGWLEGGVL